MKELYTIAEAAKEYKINLFDLVRAVQQRKIPFSMKENIVYLNPPDLKMLPELHAQEVEVAIEKPEDGSFTLDDLVQKFNAAKERGEYQADFSELIAKVGESFEGRVSDLKREFLQKAYSPEKLPRATYMHRQSVQELASHLLWVHQLGADDEEMRKLLKGDSSLLRPHIEEKVVYLHSLGCTGKNIVKISLATNYLFNITLENIQKHVQYLREVGVREDALAKVITRSPQSLTGDIELTMKPRLKLLAEQAGVTGSYLARMANNDMSALAFRLEDRLPAYINYFVGVGMVKEDVLKAIQYRTQVLHLSLPMNIKPKVEYFLSLGFTGAEMGTMFRNFPPLFTYSIRDMFIPHVEYLQQKGIPPDKLKAVILRAPRLLVLRIDRVLEPNYQCLRAIGLSKEEAAEIIMYYPRILSRAQAVRPTFDYLMKLGLSNANVLRVFQKNWRIFSQPEQFIKNADVMVEYFQSLDIKMRDVAVKDPTLFTQNREKVAERVRFLQNMGATDADLYRIIHAFPQILALDIAENLQPKYNFLT